MDFYQIERDNLAQCEAIFINVFNNPPWNESWEKAAVIERFEDCYHTPGCYGLIARINDEAVGFTIGHIEQWDKGKYFYLKEMCIVVEQQRNGIGTALINALEKNLKNEGVKKLYLHTARDTSAQFFYETIGFHVNPKMIMMAKWL